MAKGIFYVETRLSAPEHDAEFNTWYDKVHLPQVVALDGFVSARRLAPVADDGPCVALYEIESDDLQAVIDKLLDAAGRGGLGMSEAMQSDPPPTVLLLEVISEHSVQNNRTAPNAQDND